MVTLLGEHLLQLGLGLLEAMTLQQQGPEIGA